MRWSGADRNTFEVCLCRWYSLSLEAETRWNGEEARPQGVSQDWQQEGLGSRSPAWQTPLASCSPQTADRQYMEGFNDELEAFKERVRGRAKLRIEKAMKEYEEEERKKRLGPGGLDPVEVYESLPEVRSPSPRQAGLAEPQGPKP